MRIAKTIREENEMKRLYEGKRCDNGETIIGYLLQTPICTYIVPPNQGKEDPDLFEVIPDSVHVSKGKE